MGQTLRLKVPSIQQVKGDGASSPSTMTGPGLAPASSSSSSSSSVSAQPLMLSTAPNKIAAAPVPTAAKRRDTKALKHAMLATLGAKGPEYWSIMKRFIQGQINRVELEALTAKLLTPANHALHNRLFGAIQYNVFCKLNAPLDKRSKAAEGTTNKRQRYHDALFQTSREELKRQIMSLPKNERADMLGLRTTKKGLSKRQQNAAAAAAAAAAAQSSAAANAAATGVSSYQPLPQISPATMPEYRPGVFTPSSCESGSIPSQLTLKAKMTTISIEEGLLGISDQAVQTALIGLEYYLRNVLEELVHTVRDPPLGLPTSRRAKERHGGTLRIRDLDYFLNVSPHLFMQTVMPRERAKSRLWEMQAFDASSEEDDTSSEEEDVSDALSLLAGPSEEDEPMPSSLFAPPKASTTQKEDEAEATEEEKESEDEPMEDEKSVKAERVSRRGAKPLPIKTRSRASSRDTSPAPKSSSHTVSSPRRLLSPRKTSEEVEHVRTRSRQASAKLEATEEEEGDDDEEHEERPSRISSRAARQQRGQSSPPVSPLSPKTRRKTTRRQEALRQKEHSEEEEAQSEEMGHHSESEQEETRGRRRPRRAVEAKKEGEHKEEEEQEEEHHSTEEHPHGSGDEGSSAGDVSDHSTSTTRTSSPRKSSRQQPKTAARRLRSKRGPSRK